MRINTINIRASQGFSLVELMVAALLSLIILIGVVQIFLSNKHTYNAQEGLSRVQETGRFALTFLGEPIRWAGYTGCGNLERITVRNIAWDTTNDAPLAPNFGFAEAIVGYENGGGWTAPTGTTVVRVAGTDVFEVQGMDPGSLTLLGNLAADNANIQIEQASFAAGEALFITDCQNADLFCATNVSQGGGKTTIAHASNCNEEWSETGGVVTKLGGTNRLSKAYQDDASVARFITATYFIGVDTSLPAADQVPTLYSQINGAAPQELVEGVRDMQLLFGVDSNGDDRIVDQYLAADNGYFGTADNWGQVVSVRVGIIAESPTDALAEDITVAYQMPIAANATVSPANQSSVTYNVANQTATFTSDLRRMRQSFNTTFALRNRLP